MENSPALFSPWVLVADTKPAFIQRMSAPHGLGALRALLLVLLIGQNRGEALDFQNRGAARRWTTHQPLPSPARAALVHYLAALGNG